MRVRIFRALNMLNALLMMHIEHLGLLAEKVDRKLLVIKIIEISRLVKNNAYLWYYQISKGIGEILKYAHNGVKEFQGIRKKKNFVQLQLLL